ncbi:hypothetical protein [Blastococcus litoris]|uniref:hypothetical protein n=1 Tax=Blastococcus litoris TaxID=2171622 RepID=UPI000E30511D|nr:hypothetical protein [Blastococcus litoris]
MRAHRSGRLAGPLLSAGLALSGVALAGCGDDLDDQATAPELEAAVPDIRGEDDVTDVYTGLLDERFVEDLPAYEDQEVTVLGEVAEVLSPRVFSLTSIDESDVDQVLVVTTAAADARPEPGAELVVAATPETDLDAQAVVTELDLDVDADELGEWEDEAYLVATIVEPAM